MTDRGRSCSRPAAPPTRQHHSPPSAGRAGLTDLDRMSFDEMRGEMDRSMGAGQASAALIPGAAAPWPPTSPPSRPRPAPIATHAMWWPEAGMTLTPRGGEDYEDLLALDESVQKKGISDRVRRRLPTGPAERRECGSDCQVCKEPITARSRVTRLPCRHTYHEDCIMMWLDRSDTCPVCRHVLKD